MQSLLQDVRFGLRTLRKKPGSTLLAILALALGIGANTALFSAVYGVLLKPLPYANGPRLVLIDQENKGSLDPHMNVSVKELEDYRQQTHSFENLVEYHSMSFILLGREPDRVDTGVVSANFFDVLGVKPLLGRTFQAGEDRIGAEPVLVLSYKYWQEHHGGDPKIVGKAFRMNDKMHVVIGVLPPIPQFPRENDVYMPSSACPFRTSAHMLENRSMRMLHVFGAVKPGVTLEQASADAATVAARFPQQYPESYADAKNFGVSVHSLQEQLTHKARPLLFMLLATAALVLLISCANVANLALARMTQREHEMAIRTSLGAPKARLIRQVLTECILLSLAGGALGLILASVGTKLLATFLARFTTRAAEIRIDGSVLSFALITAIATGLLFGLAPALKGSRRILPQLQAGTRSSSSGRARFSLRNLLIVSQVCVSYVILVVAGLTLRSFDKLQKVDPGFETERVVAFVLPQNFTKYDKPEAIGLFEQRVQDRLRELPGVTSAGAVGALPLTNPNPSMQQIIFEGRPVNPNAAKPELDATIVSPDAFHTLGVPMLRGRDFLVSDTPKTEYVTILSASTARRYWGNDDPVGHRISADNGEHWWRIIGVVGDVHFYGLDRPAPDEIYASSTQFPGTGNFVLRTTLDPVSLQPELEKAIHAIDPEQPVTDIRTLREIRDDSLKNPRVTSLLLSAFASLALVLAATGLFGVISFLVSERTREIGIRMALGARKGTVLLGVMNQGIRMVVVGLLLGFVLALAATRAFRSLLFNVSATDALTFAGVSLVLVGTALLASYFPARRASQVEPMEALRYE